MQVAKQMTTERTSMSPKECIETLFSERVTQTKSDKKKPKTVILLMKSSFEINFKPSVKGKLTPLLE